VFEREKEISVENWSLSKGEAVAGDKVPGNFAIPDQIKINLIELRVTHLQQVNGDPAGYVEAKPDRIVNIAKVRADFAKRLPAV
jgi:hypothetical protein